MAAVNLVQLSEAVAHNRFSAEFFDPRYVFEPVAGSEWAPIGRVLKKCEYGLSISMNSVGKGFPIFRMNELDGCFALRPEKFANISQSEFNASALQENDVLFNRTNSFEFVGRTGIVKDQTDCTFASYLIRLVPDASRLLPEFLTVYLNTPFGIGQIKRRAMRSINQANVSGSEVRKILIPLVDVSVQQEVADLVNAAFSKQRDGLSYFATAEGYLETGLGLDKLSFQKPVGYDSRFSTVGWSETFSAGRVDAQCFAPDARFYENWLRTHTQCDRLGSLLLSTAKGRQQADVAEGSTDYCSIKHISGRELVEVSKCFSQLDTPLAGADDLLLAITGATIGKIGIVKRYGELAFSGDLLRLRTAESIDPHYLLLALDHKIGQVQFNRWITGSTNGHLAPRDVARVLVPRLSSEAEANIAELVRSSLLKRHESEQLLEQAIARVEQLIEEAIQQ
jgi:type I restriction enzyme S subunit